MLYDIRQKVAITLIPIITKTHQRIQSLKVSLYNRDLTFPLPTVKSDKNTVN